MKKVCTKCHKELDVSFFYPAKGGKYGVRGDCKYCMLREKQEYWHSKKGLVSRIYGHQRASSKQRKHPMPCYSNKELYNYAINDYYFNCYFEKWVSSGYDTLLTPSFDRIDDYEPYTLDNLYVTTWDNNRSRSHSDRRMGVNNKCNKATAQMDLDGNIINVFHSGMEASRVTGIGVCGIKDACKGRIKTSGGYKWKRI